MTLAISQPGLFDADHDGATYDRKRDKRRLNVQLQSVFDAMKDGVWRSLARIHAMTGAPEASISARIRDLKKSKFGGYTIERRHVSKGLWEYRLVVRPPPNLNS